ncbi:hypothetical protein ABIF69_001729 [Bradyrhizobium japonicum]|jgi:hypothetical protein
MNSRRLTIASAKTNHALKKPSTDQPGADPGSPSGVLCNLRLRLFSIFAVYIASRPYRRKPAVLISFGLMGVNMLGLAVAPTCAPLENGDWFN